jgi:hypothetical protein
MVVAGKYQKCTGSGFYENNLGVVWVRAVDRDYKNAKKKPKMYMMYKRGLDGNFRYISGLFATAEKKTYSFDEVNEVGVKNYYHCIFEDDSILICRG